MKRSLLIAAVALSALSLGACHKKDKAVDAAATATEAAATATDAAVAATSAAAEATEAATTAAK